MHFSLIKINPPDTPPSHGFDDVILPLYYALRSLGYDTEIRINQVNPRSKNIVFGSCIAPRRTGRMLPPGSIVFNLEQIIPGSKWCNDNYLAHLREFTVWDYSAANIRSMEKMGVTKAVPIPLGYVPEMTRVAAHLPPDIDVLFYGLITDRRHEAINALLRGGVKVLASQEAFGPLRDKLLGRARLVLNLHQFLPARLEVVRLGYVWANKRAVLSERREDTDIPGHLREACAFVPCGALPETARKLLSDQSLIDQQAAKGFAAFASRPMARDLARIVGRRNRPAGGMGEAERRFAADWLITP